jgi:hypothetical protein
MTDPSGKQVVAQNAITSWAPGDVGPTGFYYIDLGVQF